MLSRLILSIAILLTVQLYAQSPVIHDFAIEAPEIILGGSPELNWNVSNSRSLTIDRGVGNVSTGGEPDIGSTVISPFAQTPLVARGATWTYLDNGSDQGSSNINAIDGNGYSAANWKHPAFPAIGWSNGPAPLGYGDAAATVILFGPNPDNANNPTDSKFITTYYRHAFNVSPADLAQAETIYLDLQRDDGAIVFLNGEEVARSQMPNGAAGFQTRAISAAGAERETTFWRYLIDPTKVLAGNNVLAVEIHQVLPTSSDTRFDLELIAYRSATVVGLLPFGATWNFLDDGSDLGLSSQASATAWFGPAFNDSAWSSGPAPLGYDSAAPEEVTVVGFGPNPNKKFATTYYRHSFQVTSTNGITNLNFGVVYDDGMIGYLNGVEIMRGNMPLGNVASTDFSTLNTPPEGNFQAINVAAAPLLANGSLTTGVNVFAVEIHQATATSSDTSLDVILTLVDADANNVDAQPIVSGSIWSYLDDGSDQGGSDINAIDGNGYAATNWKHPAFDDSSWATGPSELGYGDGPFDTALTFGPNALAKPITTYFRTRFTATQADIDLMEELVLNLTRDDGAVVYLNGQVVAQPNLPAGAVGATSTALADQRVTDRIVLPPNLLVPGVNHLAVEVHQVNPSSNDLLLDAELIGNTRAIAGPIVYTLDATNDQGASSATTSFTVRDAPTDKVFLVTSVPTAANWTYRVWSNGLPAGPGNDYVVFGHFAPDVRAGNASTNPIFPGDSLELNGTRARLIVDQLSGKLNIDHLILNGGSVLHNRANATLTLSSFGDRIEVLRNSRFDLGANDGRILQVPASLSGPGGFTSLPSGRGSLLRLTGNNRDLHGDVVLQNIVEATGLFSLGNGHVTIDGGQLSPGYNISLLDRHLEITAGSTTNLILRRTLAFETATIAGNVIPPGSYSGDALFTAFPTLSNVITDDGGTLIIGGIDSDLDNLLDSWENANLTVPAPPTLDADMDGLDSAAEYAAGSSPLVKDTDKDGVEDGVEVQMGTDPSDPNSNLFISNFRETNADEYGFSFSAVNGRVYQIRASLDLVTWTGLSPTIIGNASGQININVVGLGGTERYYFNVELLD